MSYSELIGPELLKRELGVHDWADDRGGKTAHGVTERVAERLGYDIDTITHYDALEIFEREYYHNQRLDEMPDISIAWRMAVDGLHSGSRSVMKRLQTLCNLYAHTGLEIDGKCGDKTIDAVNRLVEVISVGMNRSGILIPTKNDHNAVVDIASQLKGLQFAHYYNICLNDPSQEIWWKGWCNRIRYEPDFYLRQIW